jgi:glycosyltransferase involved in cell wall biosynthesis
MVPELTNRHAISKNGHDARLAVKRGRMVVLLAMLPTPYRIPLFNLIADKLTARGERFHVLFKNPTTFKRRQWNDVLRDARFEYSVMNLPKIELAYDKVLNLPIKIGRSFEDLNPSCIVIPGFDIVALNVIRYARRNTIPYVVWSGGTHADFENASVKPIRRMIRKKVVRHATSFVAFGTETKRYLQSLGAQAGRISIGINSVDTDFFQRQVAALRNSGSRNRDGKVHILYVGHLQTRKGLDLILRALARIPHQNVVLDVVGEGPQRAEYEALIRELQLDCVRLHGFKQKEELPEYYAAADFLIFPSTEELFGLVLVEAAAAGLPIIASKSAGGTADLVYEGSNGFVVDPTDIEIMAERMKTLCEDAALRTAMGEYSLKIVSESVNIHKSADGFVAAIMQALETSI